MIKTKSLIITGSIIIGLTFLLVLYFALISLGVINSQSSVLTIQTSDMKVEYTGKSNMNESFEIKSGELRGDHTIEAVFTGSQTDIGSSLNYAIIKIVDSSGSDVTDTYSIDVIYGELVVEPIRLLVKTGSDDKPYDERPLYSDRYEIIEGELMRGHYIVTESLSSITKPGIIDNELLINIYDEDNNKVTDNYNIIQQHGRLEVGAISIFIYSLSAAKVYDGTPLKHNKFEVDKEKSKILKEHEIEIIFTTAEFSSVGSIDNTFTVAVVDKETGADVSDLYKINADFGKLEILPSIYSDEEILKINTIKNDEVILKLISESKENIYLRDKSFGDYTGSGWNNASKQDVVTFNPLNNIANFLFYAGRKSNEITIDFVRQQIPYLTPNYMSLNQGNNDVHNFGKISAPYKSYTTSFYNFHYIDEINKPFNNVNINQDYTDFVKKNYLNIDIKLKSELLKIGRDNGILENSFSLVRKIKEYIENIADYNIEFDEIDESTNDIILYFLKEAKNGNSQHFASAAVMMYRAFDVPARYVIGYFSEPSNNKTMELTDKHQHAWVEVYDEILGGWVTVEVTPGFDKQRLVVKPKDMTNKNKNAYTYNGFEQGNEFFEYELLEGTTLLPGHQLRITTDKFIDASDVDYINQIKSIIIFDEDNNDVTDRYNIEKRTGKIKINKAQISIKSGSKTKDYDGKELFLHEVTYNENELFSADYLVIEYLSSITEPGKIANKYNVWFFKKSDDSSSNHNYELKKSDGQLKINKITLTIKTGDQSSVYNGQNQSPEVVEGVEIIGLINGHTASYLTTVNAKNVGTVENSIEVFIDPMYEHFYDIVEYFGDYDITPASITIRALDQELKYNGETQYADNELYEIEGSFFGSTFDIKLIASATEIFESVEIEIIFTFHNIQDSENFEIILIQGYLTIVR